jgi:perosamine synthetase
MDSVLTCLVTESLGPGELGDKLIQLMAERLNLHGGVAYRERSRALATALRNLDMERGTTIALDPLVPWFCDETIRSAGLVPRYVDVSSDVPCVDIAAAIGLHPDAVIATSHLGYLADLDTLAESGIATVEDITEGVGSHTGRTPAGGVGRFVVVGMESDAVITAGGGAALLCRSRSDRNVLRHLQDLLPPDAMMADMNASLGLTQLRQVERFLHRRNEIADVYRNAIARGRHRCSVQSGDGENTWFSFPVTVEGSAAEVIAYARKKGVEARPAFSDSVLSRFGRVSRESAREPDFCDPPAAVIDEEAFPNARSALLRCVLFPLYPSLTGKEVNTVARVIASLP